MEFVGSMKAWTADHRIVCSDDYRGTYIVVVHVYFRRKLRSCSIKSNRRVC